MAGSMVYRLPVGKITAPYMKQFRDAMAALQGISDDRGYNNIAGFHGAPGRWCWHHQFSTRTPVTARLFLPWHRAYLWWLEQALQDRTAGAAVPWWDWTKVRDIPPAYASQNAGGAHNPLFNFHMRVSTANPPIDRTTVRGRAPRPVRSLPTRQEVTNLLNTSDFDSFNDGLEDLHDRVHGIVGGDMGDINTAAFDPIFFAHHCMIDRVWYLWQIRYGNGGIPVELLDMPLQPFGKTFKDVLNVQALGYDYAASATEINIAGVNPS